MTPLLDPAPTRTQRRLRAGSLAVILPVLLLVWGEVLLAVDARLDARAAEEYQKKNAFLAGRAAVALDRSLWKERFVSYRPGARFRQSVDGQPYSVTINRRGFRTHEFEVPKPEGGLRVVCVGASTTVEGQDNDRTYPAILERLLGERFPGRRVEVLNLGISGTRTDYWLERLDALFALEPDLVIQYDAANDIVGRHLERHAAAHPVAAALLRSRLVERFAFRPRALDPELGWTLDNYRRLGDECRRRGVDYLLGTMALPDSARARSDFRRYLDRITQAWTKRPGIRYYRSYEAVARRLNRLLAGFAPENRLALVDVGGELSDPALFTDLCHLTQPGIERHARAFLPAVSRWVEGRAGSAPAAAGR